ncbi:MAG: hypothetical protein AB3N16_07970 [Flavobacteriaceae bacterium]
MASRRVTYKFKTNNPADPTDVRKFLATEANEVKEAINGHAEDIDRLLAALGINEGTKSIGEFETLAVLQAAYPDGAGDSYAIINDGIGTPQVATYNSGTGQWEVATPDDPLIWVADHASLPNPGTANRLYVTLDTGAMYYWASGNYTVAGGTPPESKIKWIANSGRNWRVFKAEANNGAGLEIGDEVNHRMVAEKRLVVGYILDPSLTLPADFTDPAKFERYIDTKPML